MCETVVDPPFCGRLDSLIIVEGWSSSEGSSRIWMMGVVDGEVNEVEILEFVWGGVVCNGWGLVCVESGEMWIYGGVSTKNHPHISRG
jgi:hypothetical protein